MNQPQLYVGVIIETSEQDISKIQPGLFRVQFQRKRLKENLSAFFLVPEIGIEINIYLIDFHTISNARVAKGLPSVAQKYNLSTTFHNKMSICTNVRMYIWTLRKERP